MEKTAKHIIRVLEHLLVIIFLVLVLDVLWQVITRYFVGRPSSFTEELSRYLLIWLAILATAYSRSFKGQMAIDFFFDKLSRRTQYIVSLGIEICIIAFALGVMLIGGINLVYITVKLGQTSASLHLPMGLVYSVVPISGLLISFFSVFHLMNLRKAYRILYREPTSSSSTRK